MIKAFINGMSKSMKKKEENNMEEEVKSTPELVEAEIDFVIEEDDKISSETIIEVEAEIIEEEKLTSAEEEIINKVVNESKESPKDIPLEEKSNLAGEAKNLLNKFKDYISGDKFDEKCDSKAKEHGINKSFIKNAFINNALGTIADVLNLTVNIVGDVIKGGICFITNIIESIVNFGASTLHKLINLVTLNCGTDLY